MIGLPFKLISKTSELQINVLKNQFHFGDAPKLFGHGAEEEKVKRSKKVWYFQNIDWEFRSLGHK